MNINIKQLFMILILLIIICGFVLLFPNVSNAAEKANIKHYTIKTEEQNLSTEKFVNIGTIHYEQPSPVYDFNKSPFINNCTRNILLNPGYSISTKSNSFSVVKHFNSFY